MMIDPLTMKIFCVAVGPVWGLAIMAIGYYFFDFMTPFHTATEIKEGNTVVGMIIGSIFMGVGICTGLIVGLSLF